MRKLATLLVLVMLLAGCSQGTETSTPTDAADPAQEEPDTSDADDGEDEADDEDPGEEREPTDEETGNTPPTVTFTASLMNGTVPFNTTLQLTADDADGDALSWSIDVGDDGEIDAEGTELPATHVVNVTSNGTIVVRATVSDGSDAVNATLRIEAAAPVDRSQLSEGVIEGRSAGCLPEQAYTTGDGGYVELAVNEDTIGEPFFVRFRSGSANDVFLILAEDGTELVREDLGVRHASAAGTGVWSASGTVPDGAATLVFVACDNLFAADNAPEEYKYDAGPDAVDPAF